MVCEVVFSKAEFCDNKHQYMPVISGDVMCRAAVALWRPEYASYMVEGTPGRPYGHRMAHFNLVEANMKIRSVMYCCGNVIVIVHLSSKLD